MKTWFGFVFAFVLLAGNALSSDLNKGDQAPGFKLTGSDGQVYELAGLRGKTVVLAWFPKAFTGG
jgi:peroxiredoxin